MRRNVDKHAPSGTIVPPHLLEDNFVGPYRARVEDNEDPAQLGRLVLSIPEVSGPTAADEWIWPAGGGAHGGAAPAGGTKWGALFVPPVGAWVYVEFQDGDPDHPRWIPGWFAEDELPDVLATDYPHRRGIVDPSGNHLVLSSKEDAEIVELKHGRKSQRVTLDTDGDVEIATSSGRLIRVREDENEVLVQVTGGTVNVEAATVNLKGTTRVNVGNGADAEIMRWPEFRDWFATLRFNTSIGPTLTAETQPPASIAASLGRVK